MRTQAIVACIVVLVHLGLGIFLTVIVPDAEFWSPTYRAMQFVVPICLIQFCESLSRFRGAVPRMHTVDEGTPAILFAVLGWALVVGIIVWDLWCWCH